jgi:hypothetical protein
MELVLSFSPVPEDSQGSGQLIWVINTRRILQVTQRLRDVDGGDPVWATWNHGNHGEAVAEEERSNFLTVDKWKTLCLPWLLYKRIPSTNQMRTRTWWGRARIRK